MNNLRYWHDALADWVGDETMHLLRYYPRDISRAYVRAPSGLVVCAECITGHLPGESLNGRGV